MYTSEMTKTTIWTGSFFRVIEEACQKGTVYRLESDRHLPGGDTFFSREDAVDAAEKLDSSARQIALFEE